MVASKRTNALAANTNNKNPKAAKSPSTATATTTTAVEKKKAGSAISSTNNNEKKDNSKLSAGTTTIIVSPRKEEEKSQQVALEAINTMVSAVDETNIKVVVRSRPLNQRELSLKSSSCLSIGKSEGKIKLVRKDKEDKEFFFDGVFDETSAQTEIYKATGAMCLERFILGYNVCF